MFCGASTKMWSTSSNARVSVFQSFFFFCGGEGTRETENDSTHQHCHSKVRHCNGKEAFSTLASAMSAAQRTAASAAESL